MELGSSNNLAQHRMCTIFSFSQNHSTLTNTTIVVLERKKLQMFSILMFFFPPTFAQLNIVATFAPMGQIKNIGVVALSLKRLRNSDGQNFGRFAHSDLAQKLVALSLANTLVCSNLLSVDCVGITTGVQAFNF